MMVGGAAVRAGGRGLAACLLFLAFQGSVAAPDPGRPAAPAPAAAAPSRVAVATSRGDQDLIVYRPEVVAGSGRPAHLPILLISGEGGWASFVDGVARALSAGGSWVGGIDIKPYFANAQDDRPGLAEDVRRFAAALARAAGLADEAPLLLGGYSFGADLSPWVAGAGGWEGRVRGLLMIGPDAVGSLQYRFTEMLGLRYSSHTFSVAGALRDTSGVPVLFIHGDSDSGSAAPDLLAAASEPKRMLVVGGAGHHFSGREDGLRAALRDGIAWLEEPSAAVPAGRSGP